jgi:galactose mutarotase-like enzyme
MMGRAPDFYKGERALFLDSGETRAIVLPERGAKIASLYSSTFKKELLWQIPSSEYSASPVHGGTFGPEDSSGFDDMFPTISACGYPQPPWLGRAMPDHGELWSLPWESHQRSASSADLSVKSLNFPFSFSKRIEVQGSILRIDYSVANHSDCFFHCLWAAHPLFVARSGMVLRVPQSCREIITAFETSEMGPIGSRWQYPRQGALDFSLIAVDSGRCRKFYFSSPVKEGTCSLVDPSAGMAIGLRFPPEQVPYLGIWVNEGGWAGQNNIGIEPAFGGMDSPVQAARYDMRSGLAPRETKNWYVEVSILPL